jgi:predicted dehydrogenase
MNVAIIGLGKIADYHLQAIAQNPQIQLVGGFDINVEARLKLPAKFYSSIEELLQDQAVDSVILLIPSGETKFEVSKRILASGKNLISEKPAVRDLAELDELTKLASTRGTFIHGAFHSRYSPTSEYLVQAIATPDYQDTSISQLLIWADSPHIINWEVVGKSSEDTSFHAEGPNILAELMLYLPSAQIRQATSVKYSDDLTEVHTQITGSAGQAEFTGITSWVRGIKQKGVRLIFADGRELVALHTEQLVMNEQGMILFDGTKVDPETTRMQKEYTNLYRELATNPLSNLELMRQVTSAMVQVAEVSHEASAEYLTNLKQLS